MPAEDPCFSRTAKDPTQPGEVGRKASWRRRHLVRDLTRPGVNPGQGVLVEGEIRGGLCRKKEEPWLEGASWIREPPRIGGGGGGWPWGLALHPVPNECRLSCLSSQLASW